MNDVLSIELDVRDGNAEVVIGKNRKLLNDFVQDVNKAEPKIKFSVARESYIDLDKLEKRASDARKQFEQIAATRLDAGNVSNLTREMVRASERSRQLSSVITAIKRELANPNRKSSIAFLTDELKAAEAEAERLNRKLNSLTGNASQGGGAGGARGGANNLKLSSFQKTNLSYQANDVLTGLASGQNPTQILAQQGGQIAQIFDPAQIAAFAAKYAGLVTVLGAGAAALALTYKITGDIRAEAERRLKVEEAISGAINKQILSQQKALKEQEKFLANAAEDRSFNRSLPGQSLDELKRRRDLLLEINRSLPAATPEIDPTTKKIVFKDNPEFDRNTQQINALNALIERIPFDRQKSANDSFNQRFEAFKKNQEDQVESEKRLEADRKKRAEDFKKDVEKAKEKVKDFEKQYLSTFSSLFQKTGSENPIFTAFNEGDQALKSLRENLKGLPKEVQAAAFEMQQKLNLRQRLEAQMGNKLSVFDLRADAENFRNPFDPGEQKKEQEEFIARFLRNNPNYLFLNNKRGLDDDARRKILKDFAPSNLTETPADRLNNNLSDKFNQIYDFRQTPEQRAVADKFFIGLTNGVNALDLNGDNRTRAAEAREREAVRQERFTAESIDLQKRQLAAQERIAANTKRGMDAAEKGGTKGIEITLNDETSGARATLRPAATASDTGDAYYDPDLDFNSRRGLTNR